MTQVEAKKKTQYPQGRMLVTRECIKSICLENSPAAKLLSVLMYWYDHSPNEATNGLFTVVRTQAALVQDACSEITEKTLHDVAGPFLQVLGFLDIEERIGGNRYTLHIDRIHEALRLYGEERSQLEKFLISILQLEKFLIDPKGVIQLEKTLINRKKLQLQLEKVRIANRKSSNCQRGRKLSPQAPLDGNSPKTENRREFSENSNEREENGLPTSSPPDDSFIPSSDLNLNFSTDSGGGENIEPPPIATTGAEMQNMHNNTSKVPEGYKTDNSETLHSDAVMENSTVSEQLLLDWVKKAGVALGLKASCDKAVVTLLPLVHGPDDIAKLLKIERKNHPTGIVYVANLARPEVTQGLQESPGQEESTEEYTPSPHGMSLAERDELVNGALAYCPDFVINGTLEAPYFVAIVESAVSIIEMGHPDDWGRIPQARLRRAEEFGARYWQQTEQREAIAV